MYIYIYKKRKDRSKLCLSRVLFFSSLFFAPGARCSRLASLIEVIGRGLIEVSLYPLISPACKDSFLCRLWFGVISVAGTCEALLLYLQFVCWISDCYFSLIFLCLFFFVFQVSSRCQSRWKRWSWASESPSFSHAQVSFLAAPAHHVSDGDVYEKDAWMHTIYVVLTRVVVYLGWTA